MRVFRTAATALAAGLLSQAALAACYVVYGPGPEQELVYRSVEPPVDLSRPLHETMPQVAPGGSLVFSRDHHGCDMPVNKLPLAPAQEAAALGGGKTPGTNPG
ncbi:hypothetical protein [Simplicispira lacusdiani]|uniref:hypothetical protein n=1 Tax=Simplicispira lacusdiani TaxID=2213010 RepID=UPI000E72D940|nr:hypothetical protein [Simplicispira lacusdiani]